MDARKKIELLLMVGASTASWDLLEQALQEAERGEDVDIEPAIGRLKLTRIPKCDVDRQYDAMARANARVLLRWEDEYPASLRHVPMCPPGLIVRGSLPGSDAPAVAIVGTRKPTVAGISFARALARTLALLGVAVVSGMARGIDTAAHEGALRAGGITVAVLGTGVDVVYPPENKSLMDEILESGGVVSEQLCGTTVRAGAFPRRNRIISGMCDAVVVVEGGIKSGALITAKWALEQGREVGAVPGFPGSFRSEGPNHLLKHGAFVVTEAADIVGNVRRIAERVSIDVRNASAGAGALLPLGGDAARVHEMLATPATIDDVALAAGLSIERAQSLLTMLEIEGHVRRDAGGYYARSNAEKRA
jgi:DNA processing protein